MKKGWIIAGAIVAAIVYYGRNILKTINLIPSVANIKVWDVSLTSLTVAFDINIQNPNASSETVNEVNGYIGHTLSTLAIFKWKGALVCKGNNEITTLKNLKVTINDIQLILLIYNKWKKKQINPLTISGFIKTDGNKIPFTTTVDINQLNINF